MSGLVVTLVFLALERHHILMVALSLTDIASLSATSRYKDWLAAIKALPEVTSRQESSGLCFVKLKKAILEFLD